MLWLIFYALRASALTFQKYDQLLTTPTSRPIVGVLTIPVYDSPNKAYIPANYVKWCESSGLRVVPILHNYSEEEIDFLLERVNGVLFTGGSAILHTDTEEGFEWTPYMKSINYLVKRVTEINEYGKHFPLFSICLGLETLSISVAGENILEWYDGRNYTTNVFFTDHAPSSHILANTEMRLISYLRDLNITVQNHGWGVHPQTYQSTLQIDNQNLNSVFKVVGLSLDKQGAPYVSMIEGRQLPIFAIMFHPEKPPLQILCSDWTDADIVHNILAIETSQHFAHFFAVQARKNPNRFSGYTEWARYSIYNYSMSMRNGNQAYYFQQGFGEI